MFSYRPTAMQSLDNHDIIRSQTEHFSVCNSCIKPDKHFWKRRRNISHLMSQCIRQPTICICETKGADQLCSNCTADQRVCFRYTDSTISLLFKSKISSFWPASVTVQPGLCQTWSELKIADFLMQRLICVNIAAKKF